MTHSLVSALVALGIALSTARGESEVQAPQAPPTTQPAAGQQKPQQFPKGPIVAEPWEKDVGVVKPEEVVTVVFKLVNPLDHDVTIEKAATSCQCTGVDVLGKVIPARGSLEMPASMRMSKAPIKKSASVTLVLDLGEGKKQPLRVNIHAEVAYAVRAKPGFIDALAPERMKGTFELVASDGKAFRVLSANGAPPIFVGHDPASAPQASYTLQYDFTAPGTVVPKYFLIETDRSDCPLLDLRVRHASTAIKPPFKVAEFRSSFGRLAPGATGTFDLEIEEVGTNRVTAARSLDPRFDVAVTEQVGDGKNLNVKFSVKAGPEAKGVVMFPVSITIAGMTYEHLVIGVVR